MKGNESIIIHQIKINIKTEVKSAKNKFEMFFIESDFECEHFFTATDIFHFKVNKCTFSVFKYDVICEIHHF